MRNNFGMNGQDAAVFVALQASKYIIIALGVKIEGFLLPNALCVS